MPSYKPRITVYTDTTTNEKLAFIAKNENRSSSNYVEYLIKQAIVSYEAEHGEIVIREPAKPEMRIPLLDPYHVGVKTGEKAADIVIDQVKKQRGKKQKDSEKPS